jgi:hypothetical protein
VICKDQISKIKKSIEDEIENNFFFIYKLFQIKKKLINKSRIKSKDKTN